MKKVVITFGLIAAAIIVGVMFAVFPLWKSKVITFENGDWVGFTSMFIALSMIFFGIKSYRDNYLSGKISFGKGLQVGVLIALIASLGYAIGWEFYLKLLAPDFITQYAAFSIDKAKTSGVGADQLQKLITQMDDMKEMYKNPLLRVWYDTGRNIAYRNHY